MAPAAHGGTTRSDRGKGTASLDRRLDAEAAVVPVVLVVARHREHTAIRLDLQELNLMHVPVPVVLIRRVGLLRRANLSKSLSCTRIALSYRALQGGVCIT